jgi:hypothetical protein
MKDYEIDDDTTAFEAELRKFKPAKFSPKLHLLGQQRRSTRLAFCLAHSVSILLVGMLLGGTLVKKKKKPVVIEKVVEQYREPLPPQPEVASTETPLEWQPSQIPLSIDGMIEQYNRRSKLLASLPPSRFSSSSPSFVSDDPNSLLLLRKSMKM